MTIDTPGANLIPDYRKKTLRIHSIASYSPEILDGHLIPHSPMPVLPTLAWAELPAPRNLGDVESHPNGYVPLKNHLSDWVRAHT